MGQNCTFRYYDISRVTDSVVYPIRTFQVTSAVPTTYPFTCLTHDGRFIWLGTLTSGTTQKARISKIDPVSEKEVHALQMGASFPTRYHMYSMHHWKSRGVLLVGAYKASYMRCWSISMVPPHSLLAAVIPTVGTLYTFGISHNGYCAVYTRGVSSQHYFAKYLTNDALKLMHVSPASSSPAPTLGTGAYMRRDGRYIVSAYPGVTDYQSMYLKSVADNKPLTMADNTVYPHSADLTGNRKATITSDGRNLITLETITS